MLKTVFMVFQFNFVCIPVCKDVLGVPVLERLKEMWNEDVAFKTSASFAKMILILFFLFGTWSQAMLWSTLLLTGFFNIYFVPYFFTLDKYYFVLVGYLSAFHEVLFSCLLKGIITSSSDYNQSNSDLFIHLCCWWMLKF